MTTEYVDLRDTMTVGQAMAHIKRTGIHKETIYTCYVTERRKLVGIVSAKDLMTTEDDVPIKDLMETEIISVTTHNDQEYVAQLFTIRSAGTSCPGCRWTDGRNRYFR